MGVKLAVPWYDLKKPSDYLSVMPAGPMKDTPGTGFEYSNSSFVLLAYIIERSLEVILILLKVKF